MKTDKAIAKLKEYAAECPIVAERLSAFIAAMDCGDLTRAVELRMDIYQFTPCSNDIADLFEHLSFIATKY